MSGNGQKLLIVDDKPQNLYATRRIVEPLGVEVEEALSGEEALLKVLHNEFFLILMDVHMPGMSGFETATFLRKNRKTSHIPIIFVTAVSKDEQLLLEGYQSGGVDYIYKPINPHVLNSKIMIFKELWSKRSELKKNNKNLKGLNEELQRVGDEVISANLKLRHEINQHQKTEEDLLSAREVADAANKAKSEFLANMSHEIRTPLNGIIGISHLLAGTVLSDEQQAYMEKINSSSEALLAIINDILDFSKIEAGMLKMELVEFELDMVLNNLSNLVSLKAQQKGLEVLFDISSDVPYSLVGDSLRLGQILLNLASNAVKFTDSGEIVITARLLERNADQITLGFSIRDTGIGLSQEQISHLFEAFTQADGSTTRKFGGTGLGLTICKRLVELMNGEISVTSEPGCGSSFEFTARFGQGPGEHRLARRAPLDLNGLNVLVVDDCATSRDILHAQLESFSFSVTEADNGEAALTVLMEADKESPIQLVIMDWQMPGMDGIETVRRIQDLRGLEAMPMIIMQSAYCLEELMPEARVAGLDFVLGKPVQRSELFDTIMKLFHKERPEIAAPEPANGPKPIFQELLQGKRVLLVEDNEINQEVGKKLLEMNGLVVTLAVNGQEAVNRLAQMEFDLVLMDIQMPVLDGYQATRLIREMPGLEQLPIIAMTANAMASDRELCLKAGMNDHIAKPIVPKQLYECVVKWIHFGAQTVEKKTSKVDVAEEEELSSLPALAGFDVESALERLGGDRVLYRKLLIKFSNNFSSAGDEFNTMVDKGDHEGARELAHKLVGVAGNLSAVDLYSLACELEAALGVKDNTSLKPLLDTLKQQLSQAMGAIEALKLEEKSRVSVGGQDLVALIAEFKRLLEEDDASFGRYLDSMRQPLIEAGLESELINLEKHLDGDDCKRALPIVTKISQQLKSRWLH